MGRGARGVVLSGEPGVGKSRLAVDVLAEAADRGADTEMVFATRSTATVPFGVLATWPGRGSACSAGTSSGPFSGRRTEPGIEYVGTHDRQGFQLLTPSGRAVPNLLLPARRRRCTPERSA